jgi:dephospho-CoA kinase
MFVVGLTGGIGSGKSTFAALLAERGARVIDADRLGREALKPGEAAWHSVVDTFGSEILSEGSMEIDRAKLAEIVFNRPHKLAALNQIVHPVILEGIAEQLEALRDTGEIVVLDAALIVEMGLEDHCDALVVVVASDEERAGRLQRDRGMSPADIRARMGSQAAAEDRIAKADIVVTNDGSLAELAAEADRVWKDLVARRSS